VDGQEVSLEVLEEDLERMVTRLLSQARLSQIS